MGIPKSLKSILSWPTRHLREEIAALEKQLRYEQRNRHRLVIDDVNSMIRQIASPRVQCGIEAAAYELESHARRDMQDKLREKFPNASEEELRWRFEEALNYRPSIRIEADADIGSLTVRNIDLRFEAFSIRYAMWGDYA